MHNLLQKNSTTNISEILPYNPSQSKTEPIWRPSEFTEDEILNLDDGVYIYNGFRNPS